MELQQYLIIVRERWRSAVITAVIVLAAVAGYTLLQTPTYQATTRLFVQTQAGSSVQDLNSGASFASQQITSYADLATSPLVLQPVIDQLGLSTSPHALADEISTTVPPETLILEITATSTDPADATRVADATAASLQSTVEQLESNGTASTVHLTVVSPAVEPSSPASPKVLRNIALGVVLAILAGLAVAVVRELLDNRVRRADDIEKGFDRPVIATIPASRDAKNLPLISAQHPLSLQAEAYRELRTNLQFLGFSEGRRSIVVTSSLSGEGKSSSAVNLAYVLAQSGARVLLIDADLRRPSLHEYLHLEGGAGLTSVLIGEADIEDVSQPLDVEGLDVLTSGPIPPNPSELLGSARMEKLLSVATDLYDMVVVDSAPLLSVTDAAVLSRLTGGTLVVAQSERVKKQQLAQALEKLEAVEARLLGVLLNRVPSRSQGVYAYRYSYAPVTSDADGSPSDESQRSDERPSDAVKATEAVHRSGVSAGTVSGHRVHHGRPSSGRRAEPKAWPVAPGAGEHLW